MIKARSKIFTILFRHEKQSIRIDYLLSNDKIFIGFSNDEIRFIHKVIFGILRHKRKLDYYISKYYDGNSKKLIIKHKIILRIGLYQLLFMNSVPDYAAVNTTVELCKKHIVFGHNLVNALMRKFSNKIKRDEILKDISIEYSHPKWLIDKWLEKWPNYKVIELLKWNNSEPKIFELGGPQIFSFKELSVF